MKRVTKLMTVIIAACVTSSISPVMAKHHHHAAAPAPTVEQQREAVEQALVNTAPIQKLGKEYHQDMTISEFKTNIDDGWAWVQGAPASKDGKAHFDPVRGVMVYTKKTGWQMIAWVGDEVSSSANPEKAFKEWQDKFTKEHCCVHDHKCVPMKIFPAKYY
jgi:hypothetical protein